MYNSRSHLIGHTGNYGSNTCLHSLQHLTDKIIVPEGLITDGNNGNNDKGRKDRPQNGNQCTC